MASTRALPLAVAVACLFGVVSAQTVANKPFECNGRDQECSWSDERNNWVCEYDFWATQMTTMLQDTGPRGAGLHSYPVKFPVKLREREDSDFAEPYYTDCSVTMYPDQEPDYPCANYSLTDLEYYSGSLTTPIILDGTRRRVSTINKQVPAATLCVGHGDIVRALVRNEFMGTYEATAIHWHGLFQRDSFWDDGPAFITQCPISPHSKYQYDFVADPAGTFWYHAHAGVQLADGMFGALIILPEDDVEEQLYGDTYDVNEPDEIVMLADWNHENYQDIMSRDVGHWVAEDGTPTVNPKATEDGAFTAGHPYVSGFINGHGEFGGNNLKPYVFNVRQDSRIRFRLVNAGATFPYRVSIDDHMMNMIALDGIDIEHALVDSFIVFPAERVDFVLDTSVPHIGPTTTDFWLRAESLSDDGEVKAIVHYDVDPENPAEVLRRPTTNSIFERKCLFTECTVAFCPWPERYRTNPNIKCTQHVDYRRNRDQDEIRNPPETLPDIEDAIAKGNVISLNYNILGNQNIQIPSVNGIYNVLPSIPPFLNGDVTENQCPPFNESYGSYRQCVHVHELEYDETYIFVMTNRWPSNPEETLDNNFPGAQTHPIHMHGHSFYVLASSQGTIRQEGPFSPGSEHEGHEGFGPFSPGSPHEGHEGLGCQNGIGEFGPYEHYCFDQATQDKNLECNQIWGNCTFKELPELIPIEEAVQKDTIVTPPHGYVIIAIRADNPGWWYWHCHIDAHVAQGMAIILHEAPEKAKDLVENDLKANYGAFPGCGSFLF